MATTQGPEKTAIEVAPGGALPSERSVVRLQLWKENAEKFLKGEPKVLGVVQVLIALINLTLGLIMMTEIKYMYSALSVHMYAPVWGSIVFIISGSLSIAAGMRTTEVLISQWFRFLPLVTTSLSFNTISSVVAAATSIISFFVILSSFHFTSLRIAVGIDFLIFILNVLEFCIAVSTSAFGCKATCCNTSEVVVILPPNPAVSAAATPMLLQPLAPPVYQEKSFPENVYKTSTGESFQF